MSSLQQLTTQSGPNFNPNLGRGSYDYIEIGDIAVNDGSYSSNAVEAADLPANAKIIVKGGEILISQVRPTRGAIAILDDQLPLKTVCSGAFYVCTANDPHYREIIWLYLRCMKHVLEKYCGGTSYPTIESAYLARFPVPLFESEMAARISDLVVAARKAKRDSERLLTEAKVRVEQLIEDSVKS